MSSPRGISFRSKNAVINKLTVSNLAVTSGIVTTPTAYSATISDSTVIEISNGVTITTTFPVGGIQEVFGSPINQTWLTTISNNGIINKTRIS